MENTHRRKQHGCWAEPKQRIRDLDHRTTQQTLLDLIRHFTVFEKTRSEDLNTRLVSITTIKKIAAYH